MDPQADRIRESIREIDPDSDTWFDEMMDAFEDRDPAEFL